MNPEPDRLRRTLATVRTILHNKDWKIDLASDALFQDSLRKDPKKVLILHELIVAFFHPVWVDFALLDIKHTDNYQLLPTKMAVSLKDEDRTVYHEELGREVTASQISLVVGTKIVPYVLPTTRHPYLLGMVVYDRLVLPPVELRTYFHVLKQAEHQGTLVDEYNLLLSLLAYHNTLNDI